MSRNSALTRRVPRPSRYVFGIASLGWTTKTAAARPVLREQAPPWGRPTRRPPGRSPSWCRSDGLEPSTPPYHRATSGEPGVPLVHARARAGVPSMFPTDLTAHPQRLGLEDGQI